MKIKHKNLMESFKLLLYLGSKYNGEDFTLRFTSGKNKGDQFICAKKNGVYTNCEMADSSHVLCLFSNMGLQCGILYVSICVEFEDSMMPDGTYKVGDFEMVEGIDEDDNTPYHIELTQDESDLIGTSEMVWTLLGTVLRGGDGAPGAPGNDGISIVSVKQITESTEDGGINVIRVTLSNGQPFDFKVRNGGTGSGGGGSVVVIDDLVTGGSTSALSAEQGKVLKELVDACAKLTDLDGYVKTDDSRLSDARTPLAHTHTKGEITDFPESLPASDVYDWAKAKNKPSYSADEVGALPDTTTIPSKASEISTNEGISEDKNVQSDLTQLAQQVGDAAMCETSPSGDADLNITDEEGYVVAEFVNGHIKTKNFDSEEYGSLYASISMFEKVGVCGASWDSGYFYYSSSEKIERNASSWIANIARRNGVSYGCYARRSADTYTFITETETDFYPYCMGRLLQDTACDLYILTFTGNDSKKGEDYLGTISDINDADYTQNPSTYYGNYGRIVEMIKAHAPNAKFIIIAASCDGVTEIREEYFNATTEIAEHYGFPMLNWCDDEWYFNNLFGKNKDKYLLGNHPIAPLQSGIAMAFERLFSRYVKNSPTYFITMQNSNF